MNILVTGGASGLGNSITRLLASDPANFVHFTYYGSKLKAGEIEKNFPNTKSVFVDFGDYESTSAFVEGMAAMDLDVLVNNALACHNVQHFHKAEVGVFQQSFEKNVAPTLRITQNVIKGFRKKKFGKIITVLTSGLINLPPLGWSEYTANKAYLLSMVKSWAAENKAFNITSNAVSPSLMLTDLNKELDERVVEMAQQAHPLGQLLSPDEVAKSIHYLVNSSQQINGINLVINAAENVM